MVGACSQITGERASLGDCQYSSLKIRIDCSTGKPRVSDLDLVEDFGASSIVQIVHNTVQWRGRIYILRAHVVNLPDEFAQVRVVGSLDLVALDV
jgi:hypothetical protein